MPSGADRGAISEWLGTGMSAATNERHPGAGHPGARGTDGSTNAAGGILR